MFNCINRIYIQKDGNKIGITVCIFFNNSFFKESKPFICAILNKRVMASRYSYGIFYTSFSDITLFSRNDKVEEYTIYNEGDIPGGLILKRIDICLKKLLRLE